jgi:outer membrane protein assembly factor BamA
LSFYPKFSIEGYNVSRKSSGLLIAGADSINVGVTYDLLEFDVSMLFNLFSINNNMKFSYTFSKYSSAIDAFIIPSSGIGVRASSQDYFKAHTLSLQYDFENYKPNRNEDINPIGRKIKIKYDYEMSKINPEYEVDNNGNLVAIYKDNKLHKLEVDWTEGFGLFGDAHCLSFRLRGATIFGPPVDDFYSFYVSGLPGMRGYPFYALGGGRIAHANLTYRFPLLTKIDTRISPLYFDKLYFSFFGDYGNAWNGKDVTLKDFKKDVGAELRLQAFSFYVFPTSIFFDAVYGMDKFTKRFLGKDVTYGKEWRFYFGILFGFDL